MKYLLIYFAILLISIQSSYQDIIPDTVETNSTAKTLEERFGKINYCEIVKNASCHNRDQIFGCLPWKTPSSCSKMEIQDITNVKGTILSKHNELRRRITRGKLGGLDSATKMKQIVWDKELQYIAEVKLGNCSLTYEMCYANQFGEKLFAIIDYKEIIDETTPAAIVIYTILNDWEKYVEDTTGIKLHQYKYSSISSNAYTISAYIIHDQIDKIGCAVGTMMFGDKHFALVCVYNRFLKLGNKIYTTGEKGCSACADYGNDYKCTQDLCVLLPNIKKDKDGNVDVQETLLLTIGDHFTAILIGSAIGIAVITLAASYVKIRFCM